MPANHKKFAEKMIEIVFNTVLNCICIVFAVVFFTDEIYGITINVNAFGRIVIN